jgi:hypothetical protein
MDVDVVCVECQDKRKRNGAGRDLSLARCKAEDRSIECRPDIVTKLSKLGS